VKLELPIADGVPLMVPFEAPHTRPGGSDPELTDQV
jgi:hypothetical protein